MMSDDIAADETADGTGKKKPSETSLAAGEHISVRRAVVELLRHRASRGRFAARLTLALIVAAIGFATWAFWRASIEANASLSEVTSRTKELASSAKSLDDVEDHLRRVEKSLDGSDSPQARLSLLEDDPAFFQCIGSAEADRLFGAPITTDSKRLATREAYVKSKGQALEAEAHYVTAVTAGVTADVTIDGATTHDLRANMAAVAGELQREIARYPWDFFSSITTRVGIVVLFLLLLQFLIVLYRYTTRLAGFYDARADALLLATEHPLPFAALVKELSPEAIEYGKAPKTAIEPLIDALRSTKPKGTSGGD